jgi:hypothetical protein
MTIPMLAQAGRIMYFFPLLPFMVDVTLMVLVGE